VVFIIANYYYIYGPNLEYNYIELCYFDVNSCIYLFICRIVLVIDKLYAIYVTFLILVSVIENINLR